MPSLALANALLLAAGLGHPAPAGAGQAPHADGLHPSPYLATAAPAPPSAPQVMAPAVPHPPTEAAAPAPGAGHGSEQADPRPSSGPAAAKPPAAGADPHGAAPSAASAADGHAAGERWQAAAAEEALPDPEPARPRAPVHRDLRDPATPPTLAGKALADELRRAAGERASERETLQAERTRLEKLRDEIAEARASLQLETQRLATMVKGAAEAGLPQAKADSDGKRVGAGKGQRGAKPSPSPVEALARTIKSMKPDQAALLLAKVDRPLAVELLRRMKAGDAAAVLDKMDAATSAPLVAQLAHKEAP